MVHMIADIYVNEYLCVVLSFPFHVCVLLLLLLTFIVVIYIRFF